LTRRSHGWHLWRARRADGKPLEQRLARVSLTATSRHARSGAHPVLESAARAGVALAAVALTAAAPSADLTRSWSSGRVVSAQSSFLSSKGAVQGANARRCMRQRRKYAAYAMVARAKMGQDVRHLGCVLRQDHRWLGSVHRCCLAQWPGQPTGTAASEGGRRTARGLRVSSVGADSVSTRGKEREERDAHPIHASVLHVVVRGVRVRGRRRMNISMHEAGVIACLDVDDPATV